MKTTATNRTIFLAFLAVTLTCGALGCKYVMPERYVDYHKGRVPVNLPRELKNSDVDRDLDRPTAAIVSITADGRMYIGTDHSPIERRDVSARIKPLIAEQAETDRMVYVAADTAADYGYLVSACDELRRADVERIGLLVNRSGYDWPTRLTVELPTMPDPNEDISKLKPNPLTLVVTISPDLNVALNTEPIGSVNDLFPLSQKLVLIFREREQNYALRPGYETRTDLPMSERVEATVTIKAPRRLKYGDVAKVVDALRGAGARPIVLQLDDLSD